MTIVVAVVGLLAMVALRSAEVDFWYRCHGGNAAWDWGREEVGAEAEGGGFDTQTAKTIG